MNILQVNNVSSSFQDMDAFLRNLQEWQQKEKSKKKDGAKDDEEMPLD